MRFLRPLLAFAFVVAAPAAFAAGHVALSAQLDGNQVVDGTKDIDGHATAALSLDTTTKTISWSVNLLAVEDPLELRLYKAASGEKLNGLTPVFQATLFIQGNPPGGVATGWSVAPWADDLAGFAREYSVVIATSSNPYGTVRGQIDAAPNPGILVFPVVASAPGMGGTYFRSDVRLLRFLSINREQSTQVTIEFYETNAAGLGGPTDTKTVTIPAIGGGPGGRELVFDDILVNTFLRSNAKGALVVRTPQRIAGSARIYNDQRAAGKGTFGQMEAGMDSTQGGINGSGLIPHLSYHPVESGAGFRSNIGWFNNSLSVIDVAFTAYAANGALLGTTTRRIQPFAQEQYAATVLFPTLPEVDDYFIEYHSGSPLSLFVYASVVDNINGDAIFVPAMQQ
jgi:hypothetical protein